MPVLLLPDYRPEAQPSDREEDDCCAQPVELPGGVLVARFGHEGERGVRRDRDQGKVEEEGRPPRDAVDQEPADERTQDGGGGAGPRPQAERPPLLLAFERRGDDRQRAGDEQSPRCPLEDPEGDQQLHGGSEPAQERGGPEPHQAEREHPPAAVVVAEGSRQDQE